MDNIFRSFFGFNRWEPPGHPEHHHEDMEDLYEDDEFPRQDGRGPEGFHFHSPDGAFSFSFNFPEPDQMFRHFEEMFKDMGLSEFPPHHPGQPALPGPQQPASPRDEMLKQPDSSPHHRQAQPPSHKQPFFFGQPWSMPEWGRARSQGKKDSDLDEEVEKKGLESFLTKPPHTPEESMVSPHQPSHSPNFSFRSVSVRTVRRPDGSVEEHRMERDGSGAEQTTVRRIKDGHEHTVTTKTDAAGRQEKQEDFLNMEDKDINKFEDAWRDSSPSPEDLPHHDVIPRNDTVDSQTKSIFKNIFGFSFPGFGRG